MSPVGSLLVETTATVRSGSALARFLGSAATQQVEAQIAVGAAHADHVGPRGLAVEEAQVRHHRPALLAEAGLVDAHDAEARRAARRWPAPGSHVTTPVPPTPAMNSP